MSTATVVGICVAIFWILFLIFLVTPMDFYRNKFDKLTRGYYRNDRAPLQVMLDHLKSFPDQWSISRDQASFPKEGAKKMFLSYDRNKDQWSYTLNSFDSSSRKLTGFYESKFAEQLALENNRRETESLMRDFYPELNGQRLLK